MAISKSFVRLSAVVAVAALVAGFATRSQAGHGYYYAAPRYYVGAPVFYQAPVFVAPPPVVYQPAPAVTVHRTYAPPVGFFDYPVYGPYPAVPHGGELEIKFKHRRGVWEVEYDFDD